MRLFPTCRTYTYIAWSVCLCSAHGSGVVQRQLNRSIKIAYSRCRCMGTAQLAVVRVLEMAGYATQHSDADTARRVTSPVSALLCRVAYPATSNTCQESGDAGMQICRPSGSWHFIRISPGIESGCVQRWLRLHIWVLGGDAVLCQITSANA